MVGLREICQNMIPTLHFMLLMTVEGIFGKFALTPSMWMTQKRNLDLALFSPRNCGSSTAQSWVIHGSSMGHACG